MASKKGLAAGRTASWSEPANGILAMTAILFVHPLAVLEWLNADMGRCRVRRTPRGAEGDMEGAVLFELSSGSGEGEGGSEMTRWRWVRQTAWKPPFNQPRSPVKPSFLNFSKRPLIFDPLGIAEASASYTMIREADRHLLKRSLDAVEGSMAESFSNEKRGRLRRVEGTERDKALGIRAEV